MKGWNYYKKYKFNRRKIKRYVMFFENRSH